MEGEYRMVTTALRPPGSPAARPRTINLDAIRMEVAKTMPSIIVHGVPGVGKTTFGARTPNPVFLMSKRETGLETLVVNQLVPTVAHFPEIDSWQMLLDAVAELTEKEHEYKTIVLDVLNGFERILFEHVCQRDYRGDWGEKGFTGYMRGYDVSQNDWRLLLNALDDLRRKRNMIVVLLCHTRVGDFANPEGENYHRYEPDLHKKTWSVSNGWADIILFMNYLTLVGKDGKGKGGTKRMLYTQRCAAYDAKNRHNLPEEIEAGGNAWESLMTTLRAVKGEIK